MYTRAHIDIKINTKILFNSLNNSMSKFKRSEFVSVYTNM